MMYPIHDPTKPPHAPPRVQVTAHVRLEMATKIAAGLMAAPRVLSKLNQRDIAHYAFEIADSLLQEANR